MLGLEPLTLNPYSQGPKRTHTQTLRWDIITVLGTHKEGIMGYIPTFWSCLGASFLFLNLGPYM